jgi:hypothetical protein
MISEKKVFDKILEEARKTKAEMEDKDGVLVDAGKGFYALGLYRAAEIVAEVAKGTKNE